MAQRSEIEVITMIAMAVILWLVGKWWEMKLEIEGPENGTVVP